MLTGMSKNQSVSQIMATVLLALSPGIAAQVWQFGPGVLLQCLIAASAALLGEAAALSLRRRPLRPALGDFSAVLTAVLLAISLPPTAPWWLTSFGALFAILIGKQVYGGLGFNPFNPAMVGYAVLLISFPRAMTTWLPPQELLPTSLNLSDCLNIIFSGHPIDGLAMATPLDHSRTELGLGHSIDETHANALFASFGGKGWQWVNAGFLLGGLWLLRQPIIGWAIPSAYLTVLFIGALLLHLWDPLNQPTPLFHLFSGATMLGAFFIATDPVSAATTPRGRWIYGALTGLLVLVIRVWGGYPDGVAFAVLLMNLAAPTIDHYTRPRAYGYSE